MKLKNITSISRFLFLVTVLIFSFNKPSFILSSHTKDSSFQQVATDMGQLKANSYNPESLPRGIREAHKICFCLGKASGNKINPSLKDKFLFKSLIFVSNWIEKFEGHKIQTK